MSSVSNSDASRYNEKVRKAREEGRERESDSVKRHQKEIARINERHHAELEKIKSAHQKQIEEMKRSSRESITQRDHSYQKDIEGLREMHRKQLETLANENQRMVDNSQRTNKNEVQSMEQRMNERLASLNQDHRRASMEQSENYEKALNENREVAQKTVISQRDKLNKAHSTELDSLNQTRAEQVGELQRKYNTYRQDATNRIKHQELQHLQDKTRMSENNISQIMREREASQDQQQLLRDGFETGLDDMRERFEEKAEAERQNRNNNVEGFKGEVRNRLDNQVRRLEQKVEELKGSNTRAELMMKREKERQVEAVKDSYGKNIENLQEQRQEMLVSQNRRRAEDLSKQRKDYDKLVSQTHRFYGEKLEEDRQKASVAKDTAVNDILAQKEHLENSSTIRMKHLLEETEQEKTRMREHQVATHEAMRNQQSTDLKEARLVNERQKFEVVEKLKDQIRKRELQHEEKMAFTVAKYEKEIARLNDEMMKVRRQNDLDVKRLTEELSRSHQNSLESQQAQAEARLRKVQEQHSKEIKTVNQRNQAQMEQLLSTIKKA